MTQLSFATLTGICIWAIDDANSERCQCQSRDNNDNPDEDNCYQHGRIVPSSIEFGPIPDQRGSVRFGRLPDRK